MQLSRYMDAVTDTASRESFDEGPPFDFRSISIETRGSPARPDMVSYFSSAFPSFRGRMIRLTVEQQEMLVEYYILRKTQTQIARLHGFKTQGCTVADGLKEATKQLLRDMPTVPKKSNKKRTARIRRLKFHDPSWLGDFEIDLKKSCADSLFTAKAFQVSNAASL